MASRLLNDCVRVPSIAFGTATAHFKKDCSASILLALQKGFLHIDAAHGYGNEGSIKQALKEWGGNREDVFICSKWGWSEPDHPHDAEAELRESLDKMGLEYLDLFECLSHTPSKLESVPTSGVVVSANIDQSKGYTNTQAWQKMEEFHEKGLVRSIGVSSFRAEHIEQLAEMWKLKPSVNQIEYHPYCYHDPRMVKMEETCRKYNIAVSPFSSLTPITHFNGGPLDPVLENISNTKGITPAEVLLAWARQRTEGDRSSRWQYQQILDYIHIVLGEEKISNIDAAGKVGGVKGVYTIPGWDAAERQA